MARTEGSCQLLAVSKEMGASAPQLQTANSVNSLNGPEEGLFPGEALDEQAAHLGRPCVEDRVHPRLDC